jgi:hypothetical protein
MGKAVGERMPSYPELIKKLGGSQGIIDRAYGLLREQGVLETRPKSGSFVTQPYAEAMVVFVTSTAQLMPGQNASSWRSYLALREVLPSFFPGATVELLLIDYAPEAAVREAAVLERLNSLNDHYRLLGVVTDFSLTCPETYAYCASHTLPLTDACWNNSANPYSVPAINPEYVWGLGLAHLREQGWRNRRLVVGMFGDSAVNPTPPHEQAIRAAAARLDPEAGCECLPIPIGDDIGTAAAEFAKRLIRDGRWPCALMVSDDCLTTGMIHGALDDGVKLAEVAPLVTLSNDGVPIHASRELTRVEVRHRAIAAEQLKTIAELLRGNTGYRPAPVPPTLIMGRSSRQTDYPDIAAPLRPGL